MVKTAIKPKGTIINYPEKMSNLYNAIASN